MRSVSTSTVDTVPEPRSIVTMGSTEAMSRLRAGVGVLAMRPSSALCVPAWMSRVVRGRTTREGPGSALCATEGHGRAAAYTPALDAARLLYRS